MMSWLNPSDSFRSLPCSAARKPTPWMISFLLNPVVTPVTILATSARVVPQAALACWVSFAGSNSMPCSVCLALTISIRVSDCSPFGPFTWTSRSLIVTVTPLTGATGFLPVRDISYASFGVIVTPRLEDAAEYLATQVLRPGFMIRHHALGSRHDRHAKSRRDLRNILHRRIDPPARARHALDGADHRCVVGIFQLDLEGRGAVIAGPFGVAANEALGLEDVEHPPAQRRGRRRDRVPAAHLGVADAGQHIADRIVDTHRFYSP